MEIVSLIVESVLAIVAIIIAAIQLRVERRSWKAEDEENKKREKEKEEIGNLLIKIENAELVLAPIRDFQKEFKELKKTSVQPVDYIKECEKLRNDYEINYKKIEGDLEQLYESLLENEERFPMAYGYGRYILDFRKVLDFDNLKESINKKGYFKYMSIIAGIVNPHAKNGTSMSDKESELVLECINNMSEVLDCYNEHAELIRTILSELNIKYKGRNS